jgi:hypothetical protein
MNNKDSQVKELTLLKEQIEKMKSEKSDYLLKYQQLAQKYDLVVKQISEYQK